MEIIGKDFLFNLKPDSVFFFSNMKLKKTNQSDSFVKAYLGRYFLFDHTLVINVDVNPPTKDSCFYLPSNLQVNVISY